MAVMSICALIHEIDLFNEIIMTYAGMREIEVRLDGWCEGGLGQQRNDGGGCAKDRKEWTALVHK